MFATTTYQGTGERQCDTMGLCEVVSIMLGLLTSKSLGNGPGFRLLALVPASGSTLALLLDLLFPGEPTKSISASST